MPLDIITYSKVKKVETSVNNIINGTTDIAFSDEDLTATNLADAISEVNDRVDATDVIIDSVTGKAYKIVNSVADGVLTQTLEEVL
jgi:hypothetical protein